MFSGIVAGLGTVLKVERRLVTRFTLRLPVRVKRGDSVCIDGVCLTAAVVQGTQATFEAVPETLSRTTLGKLRPGATVNIEPSLRAGDPIGGHFVMGHVDGTGTIDKKEPLGDSAFIWIRASSDLTSYLAKKGSVAVDGVSLTVVDVAPERFSIALVPYTLKATTLGRKGPGDAVNLEIDVLARYIERMISKKRPTGILTKDYLRRAGFIR